MAALLSSSRRRRKDRSCHFCGARKPIDCDCGGWTRKDENGKLIDHLPEMSDSSLNPRLHSAFSPSNPSSPFRTIGSKNHFAPSNSPKSDSSPFCKTCLANQNLQINLLANYLPPEADSQTLKSPGEVVSPTELLNGLPEYKASLDARYPLLCPDCSPKVSKIIKKKNYQVKAFLLNQSIKSLTRPLQTRPASAKFPLNEDSPPLVLYGMGGNLWVFQEWLWKAQGFAWFTSHCLGILGAFYGAFLAYPPPSTTSISIFPSFKLAVSTLENLVFDFNLLGFHVDWLPWFSPVELLWSFHDLTWSRVRKNKAQGVRTKISGRACFMYLNIASYFLRLMVFSYLFASRGRALGEMLRKTHPFLHSQLFVLIGISLSVLFINSLLVVETDSPIGSKAISHNKFPQVPHPTGPISSLPDHEVFSTLSLSHDTPNLPRSSISHSSLQVSKAGSSPTKFGNLSSFPNSFNNASNTSQNPASDLHEMDWEPIANSIYDQSDLLLRPQTFLPPLALRAETGIEELFEKKVKLSNNNLDQENQLKSTNWLKKLFSQR
ncbi:hypothetical protein O181_080023 [Austropuccinia psidii MF-1]|uniref:Ima1 N-terminal domain-containing protein n=1 Tax=Austropuccinia psidii MF-1 TaxID=1389203 RepID=A0A9Q3IG59_9BASI|nr:hypothetical protein [Austropuccinia psidii MF-1]